MILNILPTIQRIRATNFASASAAKAQAIYGILSVLAPWVEDGNDLMLRLLRSQPPGFMQDEQSIDGYEQSDVLWAALPLKERLMRLLAFYQTDIHQLSSGNDQKAHQLLVTAERTFEQCRKEAFDSCDSCIEEFLLYFHVLCLAHPGYRHPDNVRLYHDYDRCFNALPIEQYDEDSDLTWQYREVRWRRDILREQSFDLSLLPRLSFADEEACKEFRTQCYKWQFGLDPEDDQTIQTEVQNWTFLSEGIHSLYAWLNSKYTNGIELKPEEEATILLTIYCGINAGPYDHEYIAHIQERAFDLLDRLPASKLRPHLMAQVATSYDDSELAEAVNAAIATWDKSQLTQEDKYLIQSTPLTSGTTQ